MAEKKFNVRGFVSVLTAGGFLVMAVTGLILYVVPPGRVANWVDWTVLGMAKEEWGAIHIVSSILFVAAGVIHLVYNWKPFKAYIVEKLRQGGEHMRLEGLLGLVAIVVVVAGTMAGVPPFQSIIDLNEHFKDSWSTGSGAEPPFGHAEEVTLETLGFRIHVEPQASVEALRAAGYTVSGIDQTVRAVADANGASPAEVYDVIWTALGPKGAGAGKAAAYTPEQIELEFAGAGIGRKTVAQVADEHGLTVETAQARLAAHGVAAEPDARMKDLGEAHGYEPLQLFTAILIEGYTPTAGE